MFPEEGIYIHKAQIWTFAHEHTSYTQILVDNITVKMCCLQTVPTCQ